MWLRRHALCRHLVSTFTYMHWYTHMYIQTHTQIKNKILKRKKWLSSPLCIIDSILPSLQILNHQDATPNMQRQMFSSLNHQKRELEGLGSINHTVLKLPHYLFLRNYIGGILMKSSFSFLSGTPGLSGWLVFKGHESSSSSLEALYLQWKLLQPIIRFSHCTHGSHCPRFC